MNVQLPMKTERMVGRGMNGRMVSLSRRWNCCGRRIGSSCKGTNLCGESMQEPQVDLRLEARGPLGPWQLVHGPLIGPPPGKRPQPVQRQLLRRPTRSSNKARATSHHGRLRSTATPPIGFRQRQTCTTPLLTEAYPRYRPPFSTHRSRRLPYIAPQRWSLA